MSGISIKHDDIYIVKNVKLNEPDGEFHPHTINVTYEVKHGDGSVAEITVNKVALPISHRPCIDYNNYSYSLYSGTISKIDVGYGSYTFHSIVEKTIKKKMTVEEIEKELGYKVEIISEE